MHETRRRVAGIALLILIYFAIVFLIPKPAVVKPEGWRLFGLFVTAVAGLLIEPIPGGALVLVAITLSAIIGGLTVQGALAGYSDPTVWLVMSAFFISRALLNTGLARRIALIFVRHFGSNSTGICYALAFSDMTLATVIPSNGARTGGVVLPIIRSIAELYGSKPGETARLIGSYLMMGVYQCSCISCAMFFTGQASNPLIARLAGGAGFKITWLSWLLAGIVPGGLAVLLTPLIVRRMYAPGIHHTPEAAAFAASELKGMGPMSRSERILTAIFLGVCGMWITSDIHKVDITATALLGCSALLLTGVLKWEDVRSEKGAWDLFFWYGGLVMLGRALNDTKVPQEFANGVAAMFGGLGWPVLLGTAVVIYFYAHYAFASITAHVLAMFPPFMAVLLAKQAPIGLVVLAFACFANLSAGLTHYGTTPAPMFYAQNYVTLRDWWRIGFVISLMNLVVWGVAGVAWWKVIGIW